MAPVSNCGRAVMLKDRRRHTTPKGKKVAAKGFDEVLKGVLESGTRCNAGNTGRR